MYELGMNIKKIASLNTHHFLKRNDVNKILNRTKTNNIQTSSCYQVRTEYNYQILILQLLNPTLNRLKSSKILLLPNTLEFSKINLLFFTKPLLLISNLSIQVFFLSFKKIIKYFLSTNPMILLIKTCVPFPFEVFFLKF